VDTIVLAVLIGAIYVKVRDGQVANRPSYAAQGATAASRTSSSSSATV
jgi:transposase-like protein